ncbi:MAG: FecR domain-containing protein [Alphaproteobacteria bacterium]
MDPDKATRSTDTNGAAAAAWLAVLREAPPDAPAHAAFRHWHDADPAHAEAWRRTEALWRSPALAAALRSPVPVARGAALRPRRRWPRLAAAAAVLLMIAAAAWRVAEPPVGDAEFTTRQGERRSVVLADGSTAMLGTGTALDADIGAAARRVHMRTGESYFDVVADANRPFEVTAGPAHVLVVGTAFSVRVDDETATVAVRRGRVRVDGGDAARAVTLDAGEAVTVASANAIGIPRRVAADAAFAWTEGRLVFADRPFGEVVAELDRYLPGRVVVASSRLAARRIGGSYRLDDPEAALAAVASVVGAHRTGIAGLVTILH